MNNEKSGDRTGVVLLDGQILTGVRSGSESVPTAIYLKDGMVAAVGSNEEMLAEAGRGAPVRNLDGATVIPGLIDTHPHLLHFAAFFGANVDLTASRNHADIVDRIQEKAARTPPGGWITTTPVGEPHYFARRSWRDLDEGVLPNRHVLDRATSNHPVFIQGWAPRTPNICAANSAALAALGIDSSTPDRVSNVWIEKDANGVPTGILTGEVSTYYNDDPYFRELAAKMPPLVQPEVVPPALMQSMAHFTSMGITTVFEAHEMGPEEIGLYKHLRSEGLLGLRVMVSHELESSALPSDVPPKTLDDIRGTLEYALADRSTGDDWLRINGITSCAWGPAACGRMWWANGYSNAWGGRTTGSRQISREKVELAIDYCAERGLRLHLLSCSPDEHDEYIELTKGSMSRHNVERTGWLIEHGYVMRPDQPKKLADLGFDITVSAGFSFGKGDMLAERIGQDALDWLNPFRLLLDAGMTVSGSTDWGPTNPFEQMQLAVTHQMLPSGRLNNGPAQVVTREEAFEMWTVSAGKVLGWEGIGTLTPGSHADLAIVDRNPITCDLDDLPSARVLATMIDGRFVFDSSHVPGEAQTDALV